MQRDFAFLQTAPDRVFVGWGPFEQLPFRRPDRPAFFITDFFLDDVHPWRHPDRWEELTLEDFATQFELQIQMWKDAEAASIQPEIEVQVDVDTVPEGEPRE